MIPRYSRPEMVKIWAPETRFRIWFEIEAHACDAMAELGVIPRAAAEAVWRARDDMTVPDVPAAVHRRIAMRVRLGGAGESRPPASADEKSERLQLGRERRSRGGLHGHRNQNRSQHRPLPFTFEHLNDQSSDLSSGI